MALAKIELENVRLSVSQIVGVLIISLTADHKCSLCDTTTLQQTKSTAVI